MKSRMTTSVFWLVGIYLALTAGIAAQVAVQEEMSPQTRVYVVKGGDTLWDISTRFLNSPWYWPQLWALNPYITNPHLIYPGEPIALGQSPQVQVAQAQPPQVGEEQPAVPAPEAAAAPIAAAPEAVLPTPEAVPAPEAMAPAPFAAAPAPEVVTMAPEAAAPALPAPLEVATPEEYVPAEPEAPPPPVSGEMIGLQEVVYYAKVTNHGFISPGELGKMGLIVESAEEKILLSAGDVVYTNLGDASGVKVGDRFSILEQGEKVFHPKTKKLIGYQVEILGDLQITELNGDVSTAKILHSYNVISRNNYIRAFEPAVKEIDLKQFSGQLDGMVIGSQNPVQNSVEKDIVYLDRGAREGLTVGNLMLLYRPGGSTLEPGSKKKLNLPPRLLGKMLIVDVKDETAAGLITSSLDTIMVGDCFRSGIY
ncbi:MAG: LysM domain-containing protein [Proteobacteria bacterium]|nr:LysM domain-containing protein [Pseudomonadota bacterium]